MGLKNMQFLVLPAAPASAARSAWGQRTIEFSLPRLAILTQIVLRVTFAELLPPMEIKRQNNMMPTAVSLQEEKFSSRLAHAASAAQALNHDPCAHSHCPEKDHGFRVRCAGDKSLHSRRAALQANRGMQHARQASSPRMHPPLVGTDHPRSGLLLGGASVDGLRVALGHLLDQALAQQLPDGGTRQRAVDLRTRGVDSTKAFSEAFGKGSSTSQCIMLKSAALQPISRVAQKSQY